MKKKSISFPVRSVRTMLNERKLDRVQRRTCRIPLNYAFYGVPLLYSACILGGQEVDDMQQVNKINHALNRSVTFPVAEIASCYLCSERERACCQTVCCWKKGDIKGSIHSRTLNPTSHKTRAERFVNFEVTWTMQVPSLWGTRYQVVPIAPKRKIG